MEYKYIPLLSTFYHHVNNFTNNQVNMKKKEFYKQILKMKKRSDEHRTRLKYIFSIFAR